MTEAVGIDVGGTKMLGVVVSEGGVVVRTARRPTPSVAALLDDIAELVAQLGGDGPVGIGIAGMVTREGVVRSSPNLPGVVDLDVKRRVESITGRRVEVDNDATCALAAEWRGGAAVGARDAWLVTLGTGIGAPVVAGGAIQRGGQGFAGEIGHMIVVRDGVPCPCGRRGCWERYASGTALGQMANDDLHSSPPRPNVLERARAGEDSARAVVAEWIEWVALGVSNLVNATDPEVVILGGGAGSHADVAMAVSVALDRHLYAPSHRQVPRIVPARCGEHAGAIGSALLTRE